MACVAVVRVSVITVSSSGGFLTGRRRLSFLVDLKWQLFLESETWTNLPYNF